MSRVYVEACGYVMSYLKLNVNLNFGQILILYV